MRGIFFARRDQNQQVTQFGGSIPNTPLVVFPVVSATGTVAPPVTINTPLQVAPSDPTFATATAASPISYLIRTGDLHNNPNPYVAQWNFNVQYELVRDLLVETSYRGQGHQDGEPRQHQPDPL